jgi:hypothetical protein
MVMLSGKQSIDLSPDLLVELQGSEGFNVEYSIDGYLVKANFNINHDLGSAINTNTGLGLYRVDKIEIIVSKEVDSTPDIPLTEDGAKDFTTLHPYFNEHRPEYSIVIRKAFKGILRYFKYALNQPFLDDVAFKNNKFSNIQWFDDTGNEYGSLVISITSTFPSVNESVDVKPYREECHTGLLNYLTHDSEAALQHQILSDAQAALLEGNLRRGVFEMAVTCELSVKRTFFSQSSFSGDAFEYLEDKGKVKIGVVEFISKVAAEVFGESFKETHGDDFDNIDHLFRCRNKIAHRGELTFKDDSGALQNTTAEMAKNWYLSVRRLLEWLNIKLNNANSPRQ